MKASRPFSEFPIPAKILKQTAKHLYGWVAWFKSSPKGRKTEGEK